MVHKRNLQSFNHTPEVKEHTAQSLEEKKKKQTLKGKKNPKSKNLTDTFHKGTANEYTWYFLYQNLYYYQRMITLEQDC